MQNFTGKSIFITGGASGIGLEAGRQLALLGAHIVVLDTNLTDQALDTLQAARRSPTQRVSSYQLDISNRQLVLDVAAKAVAECGAPDVLIHSAGIALENPFLESNCKDFDRVMQVNLYGTRHICEALVPVMVACKKGQIVLVASMAGHLAVYGYTSYASSKFAVRGFAEALRYELKPLGVNVQCFCPGEVDTPMVAKERKTIHPATRAMKKSVGTLTVEAAVHDLLKGIRDNKPMIISGSQPRLMFWLQRLLPPSLWYRFCDRLVADALKGGK